MLSSQRLRALIVTILRQARSPVTPQNLFRSRLLSAADDRKAILVVAEEMLKEGLLKQNEGGLYYLP